MDRRRIVAGVLGAVVGSGLALQVCGGGGPGGLGACAYAAGAKAAPKIESFEPDEQSPGYPVRIKGANFGDKQADVKVTMSDQPALVLQVADGEIMAMVPEGAKKGTLTVRVTVGTATSNSASLKVDPNADHSADKDREKKGGAQREKMIALDMPAYQSGAVLVSGKTALLPECTIDVTLTLGDSGQRVVGSAMATVGPDRSFQVTFGPYPRALLPARYWVDAVFKLGEQSKSIKRAFKDAFKGAELSKRMNAADRQPVEVGDASAQLAVINEVRAHGSSMIAKLKDAHRDLEVAYGAALRSVYRKGKEVLETDWEERLNTKSLQGLPPADRAAWLKAMRGRSDVLTSAGGFNEPKWREFVDGLCASLGELDKTNQAFIERFKVMRDPELFEKITGQIAYLQRIAHQRSRDLYELNKLPFNAADPDSAGISGAQFEADLHTMELRLSQEWAQKQ
ncbi:MAG TPA: IPT/TIG domain-containing protein [Planctomycetota bacterium]|nr:IPT/TIG domain-containing protein [Planctomycetota bacterium]